MNLQRLSRATIGQTILAVSLIAFPAALQAKVTAAYVFGDSMVLQRDTKASIWGSADPGEKITLTLTDGNASVSTVAGPDGHWIAAFQGLKPGGAFVLTISGAHGDTLTLKDILVGDVWVCSGQSNMEYPLKDADEIAAPEDSNLRQILIPRAYTLEPAPSIARPAQWFSASPAHRPIFTAVGYYFAKRLRAETGVPIGLIHTSWGGTAIERWTPRSALDAIPGIAPIETSMIAAMRSLDADAAQFALSLDEWQKRFGPIDPGNKGFALGYAKPDLDTSTWKPLAEAGDWSSLGIPNGGVVWIRRTIPIPAALAGKDFSLNLDVVPGLDTTYLNGVEVGHAGDQPPYFWDNRRTYIIPGKLIKQGDNLLAVRVVTQSEKARTFGTAARINGHLDATTIPQGWVAMVETAFNKPLSPEAIAARPKPPSATMENLPTDLYNAMVYPLIPYGIKGVLWYQGENNASRGYNYRFVFPAMIESWRTAWGQGPFPFYFVQLANLGHPPRDANEPPGWAEVRESQLVTWQTVPHTGMAVTVDIGDPKDIHPKNKKDVGERLALFALANDYGRKIEDSGPVYQSMEIDGDKVRLSFTHCGKGLIAKGGGPLQQFSIAGADKKFFWANAVIEGNEVVVSSKDVPNPVAVRYAFFPDPEGLNLYNVEGLPATPFRTDTWDAVTKSIWW